MGRIAGAICLAVAVLAAIVLVVVYLILVHTHSGSAWDLQAYHGALQIRSPVFNAIDSVLYRINRRSLEITMIALFGIGIIRGRPILGATAVFVAGASVAAAHTLRYHLLHSLPITTVGFAGFTYPSQHVTTVVACAMGAILVCPWWMRGCLGVLGAILAVAVGVRVQALGWHQVVDVLGGMLIPLPFLLGSTGILAMIANKGPQKRVRHWPSVGFLLGGAVLSAALLIFAAPPAAGLHAVGGATTQDGRSYWEAMVVSSGLAAIVFGSAVALVGDDFFEPEILVCRWWSHRRITSRDNPASLLSRIGSGMAAHDHVDAEKNQAISTTGSSAKAGISKFFDWRRSPAG
jgi:hypothetical protein